MAGCDWYSFTHAPPKRFIVDERECLDRNDRPFYLSGTGALLGACLNHGPRSECGRLGHIDPVSL
jgi:hypothetical protein